MDFRREAVEKLRSYASKKVAVENLAEEMVRLRCQMDSIRSATTDSVAVRGGSSTREDMLVNTLAEIGELKHAHKNALKWLGIVDHAMEQLDDEEKTVLQRMYVNHERGAVERLREELGLEDDRSVYKRKDRALRHFTLALYGKLEQ